MNINITARKADDNNHIHTSQDCIKHSIECSNKPSRIHETKMTVEHKTVWHYRLQLVRETSQIKDYLHKLF